MGDARLQKNYFRKGIKMNFLPRTTIDYCKLDAGELEVLFKTLGYKGGWKQQKLTRRFESTELQATFWEHSDTRIELSGPKAEQAMDDIIPHVVGTQLPF